MKYFLAIVLLTWLKLGTARPSLDNSIEARLQKLEDFVDRLKAEEKVNAVMDDPAMENQDFWTPEQTVTEEGAITVTGCTSDAAAFYNTYLNKVMTELSRHITSIKLTCGKCSSLAFEGEWSASVTLCKSAKGTPCVRQIATDSCNDPNHDDDLVFPFKLPVDGTTTLGSVNLVITSDTKECFSLNTPAEYSSC